MAGITLYRSVAPSMISPPPNQCPTLRDCIRRLTGFFRPASWQGDQGPVEGVDYVSANRCESGARPSLGWGDAAAGNACVAADKPNRERSLVRSTRALARLVVMFARDRKDHPLACRFDVPYDCWRGLRGNALLEQAGQLVAECERILRRDEAWAGLYGITPGAVQALKDGAANYAGFLSQRPLVAGD